MIALGLIHELHIEELIKCSLRQEKAVTHGNCSSDETQVLASDIGSRQRLSVLCAVEEAECKSEVGVLLMFAESRKQREGEGRKQVTRDS